MLRLFVFTLVTTCWLCGADLDRDGLDDEFEQTLLQQFLPTFLVNAADCDATPAEFVRGAAEPKVAAKNGSIHGQVLHSGTFLEVHYYHLWSKDCGRRMHHDLDAESVSVLLRKEGAEWRAAYWYAAAHENTLCDMSHAVQALTPDRGERVWISKDKHASFLSRELCAQGCGNDDCSGAKPLQVGRVINIGEPGAPMNGASWTASEVWPLAAKMQPDFTESMMARMPQGDAAELVPSRDPVRGMRSTIKVAGTTFGALETANTQTSSAVATGVGTAVSSTGKALKRAFRWVSR
jgi:hypothetical protein